VNVERVTFSPRNRDDLVLEGQLLDGGGRACVVSHPHPLAGGTMEHPVVDALWRAAAASGLRALRYNFRGVGASTGEITSTSPLPTSDLAGALDFLGEQGVLAIGYSYGARTTLHAVLAGEAIERAALVALPTRMPANRAAMSNLLLGRRIRSEEFVANPDVELVATAPTPVRVFAGDHDPLVVSDAFETPPHLMEGLNHFFSRRLGNQSPDPADLERLSAAVLEFLYS